jgi:hydroxyacylglutathione hydrolase
MFQRFFDEGLAQSSFLLACDRTREALVIDPRRDIDVYVEAAGRHGLTLRYAIETHVHADFVSGAHELLTAGATVVAGPGADLRFKHHEASDGEALRVGDIRLQVLHTPGHTPEHISIRAEEPGAPIRLFSGDTLFVGAVGRPALLGEEQTRQLASQLYDSLHEKLLTLPDDVEVHPGHGAGSLCGAGIGKEPHSTIGQERRFNAMLQHATRDAFVAAVLADLPETPPYFPRMKRINHDGPPLLNLAAGYPGTRALSPGDAAAALAGGAWMIDLRSADAFGKEHPRGAVNIGFGAKVGYWAGWAIPADARVILMASAAGEADEAARQLLRVGIDKIEGRVDGGMDAWRSANLPTGRIAQMTVRDLRDRIARRDTLAILDVRTSREWRAGHIDRATHVPVGDVTAQSAGLPRQAPIATLCEGGYRSSLAASLLARAGMNNVINVTGGMAAYRAIDSEARG